MNQATDAADQPQREIPLPPGGGSYRFNEATWDWDVKEPAPQAPAVPQPAAADSTNTEE